jgi:hypothetical protein
VNICKRRQREQAKEAGRLEPKGKWGGYGSLTWPYVNVAPPAYRMSLSYLQVTIVERGKPVLPLHVFQRSYVKPQGTRMGCR